MDKKLAIVAVSGGMDSCVTAAIAAEKYNIALAHINYGQRTEKRELKSFNDIADFYNVENKLVIDFSHLAKIGGSSLTDYNMEVSKADLANQDIPSSYVPFRNANILTACVSWAEVIGAEAIFMGAVHEDSSGYPDCRPQFFEAFERLADEGTKPTTKIKIITPIINMNKDEIIKKGIELKNIACLGLFGLFFKESLFDAEINKVVIKAKELGSLLINGSVLKINGALESQ